VNFVAAQPPMVGEESMSAYRVIMQSMVILIDAHISRESGVFAIAGKGGVDHLNISDDAGYRVKTW
jgi:hypothetical protein